MQEKGNKQLNVQQLLKYNLMSLSARLPLSYLLAVFKVVLSNSCPDSLKLFFFGFLFHLLSVGSLKSLDCWVLSGLVGFAVSDYQSKCSTG